MFFTSYPCSINGWLFLHIYHAVCSRWSVSSSITASNTHVAWTQRLQSQLHFFLRMPESASWIHFLSSRWFRVLVGSSSLSTKAIARGSQIETTAYSHRVFINRHLLMAHLTVVLKRSVLFRLRLQVTEIIDLFLLVVEVSLTTLILQLIVYPIRLFLLLIVHISRWRWVILTHASGIVLHRLPLLAVVVASLLLYPILFEGVLLVLSLQVTF